MNARQRQTLLIEFGQWGFDVRGWTPATREHYKRRIKAADQWMDEQRGKSLIWAKPADLRAYLFASKPSALNRNGIRQALVAFGGFLLEQGYQEENYALHLPRIPQPKALPKALPAKQARRVITAAEDLGPRAFVAIQLVLQAGLRHSEVRWLEWSRVDLEGEFVRFTAKGQKDRQLPLNTAAVRALARWRNECPSARWLFPTRVRALRDKQPLSHVNFGRIFRQVGEAAGVPDLHPHMLRHTFATRLLEKGIDIRIVQEALGHARLDTTAIYSRVWNGQLRDALGGLDYEPDGDRELSRSVADRQVGPECTTGADVI